MKEILKETNNTKNTLIMVMNSIQIINTIFEYFIDLDRIAKKTYEMAEADIDCIGLDLQFYFKERKIDTQELLNLIKNNKEMSTKIKIVGYFEWLVNDFKKLVDESESNCNKWQTEMGELERKRMEIDQYLENEKQIQPKIG